MARSPEWFEQLPEIVDRVAASRVELFGQREVEAIFGVSRRDAFRLLHRFGARERADALAIGREDLRIQLEAIRAGEAYQVYLRRAGQMGEQLRARRVRLPVEARALSVADLPAGIRIRPLLPDQTGRVEIEFTTREELWIKMAELARARARDRRGIDRLLEPSSEDE